MKESLCDMVDLQQKRIKDYFSAVCLSHCRAMCNWRCVCLHDDVKRKDIGNKTKHKKNFFTPHVCENLRSFHRGPKERRNTTTTFFFLISMNIKKDIESKLQKKIIFKRCLFTFQFYYSVLRTIFTIVAN